MLALVGAATAMGGVLLVVWGAQALAKTGSDGTQESLLAPTLAVDTLDPDLRIAYMRTLVVDAREAARTAQSPLGRELRRALIALQAVRHVELSTSAEPELLELVATVCDDAEASTAQASERDFQVERTRQLRNALLDVVRDPRSAP